MAFRIPRPIQWLLPSQQSSGRKPDPVPAGVALEIHLDFDDKKDAEPPVIPNVSNGTLRFLERRTFIEKDGDLGVTWETERVCYVYEAVPDGKGDFTIPPFAVVAREGSRDAKEMKVASLIVPVTPAVHAKSRFQEAVCQPLMDLAGPRMFENNAFRVTGLPVDVTGRAITRHADKLKMMEEFGEGKSVHIGAFAPDPPPTVDQIRESIQRLKEPETRVIDEFFWFWPKQFDQSEVDPAIKALENGDSETALKIWSVLETSPSEGVTAVHNAAVLWLLTALDWESYAAERGKLTDGQRQDLEKFWLRATDRWDLLAEDDLFWERVKVRVKKLDDPRLTTGFVRRMRATLPMALDKINAELAVKHAEGGRMERAEFHARFLRRKNLSADAMERIAETALAPAVARLKQQMDAVRQRTDKAPGDALKVAKELLGQAPDTIALCRLLLGEGNYIPKEMSDEIAALCNRLQVQYHNETGNNQACLDLLKVTLPLAVSAEIRQQIEKNIATVKNNLAYDELEPVLAALNRIMESRETPRAKLARIKQEIMPLLETRVRAEGRYGNTASALANNVAGAMRSLAIDANNNHDDAGTGAEAIGVANQIVLDPELKQRLEQDAAQLASNEREADQRNLMLEIRSDQVEITRAKFRYNSHVIPTNDITGVRFGVFTQYTNGAQSSVSYKIAVGSASHGVADIECKRYFRSEEKAKNDFNAVLSALYYQIIPPLVMRLAASIVADCGVPLGDSSMRRNGIHLTTGSLFWKKDHVIAWQDVRFGSGGGYLSISSAQSPDVKKTFTLRDVWNAVIFKEIANTVVERLNK